MLSSKANSDVRGTMRNAEEIIRADIFYKYSPSLSADNRGTVTPTDSVIVRYLEPGVSHKVRRAMSTLSRYIVFSTGVGVHVTTALFYHY